MLLYKNRVSPAAARAVFGLGLFVSSSLVASAITVQEIGVNPYQTPTITCSGIGTVTVYAGVNQLVVDGVAMNGFCIDPFHFSVPSSSDYLYVPLTSAPKGYPMSSTVALDIDRLWGNYYSPTMNATAAAGLQIAIWELVGGSYFHLDSGNDYGAAGYISAVTSPTYTGPTASLVALTGPGQDYVVQQGSPDSPPQVPESGVTAGLLGAALCILIGLHRKLQPATAHKLLA